jgi:hypothetical protein
MMQECSKHTYEAWFKDYKIRKQKILQRIVCLLGEGGRKKPAHKDLQSKA